MNVDNLLNETVSIRSLEYPHFELVKGTLVNCDFIYSYEVSETGKSFRFDRDMIKQRINNTIFI